MIFWMISVFRLTVLYSKDMVGAAADGLNAGMDQEGGGTAAIDQLSTAVQQNQTTALAVAASFRRLMLARIRLGMFDPPNTVEWNTLVYNTTELARYVKSFLYMLVVPLVV
jgi:beta-glucosidase